MNLLDVAPFVELVSSEEFQPERDSTGDGLVNLLDVTGFVDSLLVNSAGSTERKYGPGMRRLNARFLRAIRALIDAESPTSTKLLVTSK